MEMHQGTALLESVGWIDEELENLLTFISDFMSKNNDLEMLYTEVESKWGESTAEILRSIINIESFSLNLTKSREDDVEN
jgi:hypothetical protein